MCGLAGLRGGRGIPEVAQAASLATVLILHGAVLALASGAREVTGALPVVLRRHGLAVIGIRRQPLWELPALLDVVGAQDSADVSVVLGVAVVLTREERASQCIVSRRRLRQQVAEVGRHYDRVCGVVQT